MNISQEKSMSIATLEEIHLLFEKISTAILRTFRYLKSVKIICVNLEDNVDAIAIIKQTGAILTSWRLNLQKYQLLQSSSPQYCNSKPNKQKSDSDGKLEPMEKRAEKELFSNMDHKKLVENKLENKVPQNSIHWQTVLISWD